MAYIKDIVTLGDVPRYHARQRPDSKALIVGEQALDYAQWNTHCSCVAQAMLAEGLAPGFRVAHMGKNSAEYFEILFGAAKAGGVLVPISWRLVPPEISFIANDAAIEILFVDAEFAPLIEQVIEESELDCLVVVIGGAHASWMSYAQWRDRQSGVDPMAEVDPQSPVLQMYTSGTTGRPKGVQLSHDCFYILEQARENTDDGDSELWAWNVWGPADVSLVNMPIFHVSGTGWGICGLYNGACNVLLPDLTPAAVLAEFAKHPVSKMVLVPTVIQMVLDHPDCATTDFSALKYLCYGASPIPLELLKRAVKTFQCGFVQMYGLTETAGAVTFLPPADHVFEGNERMRSAGRAVAGVEVAILDDNGQELPLGEVGEICVRAPSIMIGYWNQPEETAKIIGKDGWLRTGDAGSMDADGYVFIRDRVKDMIVSGGVNIYPAEVENAVYSHPDVFEVAVIGVPDPKWGEAVKALVVVKPGVTPDAAAILAATRKLIAGYKVPKSIDFVASLPRNPSGKLLKRDIRKPYWKDQERQVN